MSTFFTGSANTKVLATATLFTIGLVVYFVLIPKCNFMLLERFSRRASIFITFFIVVKFFRAKRFYLCFLVFFLCLLPTRHYYLHTFWHFIYIIDRKST